MRKADLHMHTRFCDGRDTPEQMILTAISLEMEAVGICVHGHTPFDESYCSSIRGAKEFLLEMRRLKEEYRDRIRVYAGLEQDLYSDMDPDGFDYVIGSVHYLKVNGGYYPVDHNRETSVRIAAEQFGGDYLEMAEAYYEEAASVIKVTGADLIGHLDLITKYNENGTLFDESDPRYLLAASRCIDALLPDKKPFEINMGAMARGLRTDPYPSKALRDSIREKGGRLLLSSDAHKKEDLMFAFMTFADEADPKAYDSVLKKGEGKKRTGFSLSPNTV